MGQTSGTVIKIPAILETFASLVSLPGFESKFWSDPNLVVMCVLEVGTWWLKVDKSLPIMDSG